MSRDDERGDQPRPGFGGRIGRGLSFMNKVALAILLVSLLVALFKHH